MIPESDALWVKLSLLTVPELHAAIDQIIVDDRHELVLNVNIHCMNLAWEQPWLRELLNQAAMVFCDGAGVALALRLWGKTRVPSRITYADWMWQLAEHAARVGHRLYFVGGRPGVARRAADRLRQRSPALQIVGCDHGYFAKQGAENDAVIARIAAARPHILVTGFGMPLQERWLAEHRERLAANVMLTGGAVFDYVSAETPRGPRWMTDHGMEWLARMAIEPRRLWRRYLIGNPRFMYRAWRWTHDGQAGA